LRSAAVETWPQDVLSAVADFRQGTLISSPPPFSYYGDPENPLPPLRPVQGGDRPGTPPQKREFDFVETDPYDFGVITTQTCDLAEEGRPAQPFFQACPVFKIDDAVVTLPSYLAPLDPPDLPEGSWVADLRLEVPLEKSVLVGRRPIEGFPDEQGYLDFARRLGRRRERPAVASELVDAVARTLKRRKTNSSGFKRLMRDHVHSVRLAIDEGSRLNPTVARVHFYMNGPIQDDAREKLETWWQVAYTEAEASGINLLPNAYHDCTRVDIDEYERTIPLGI
jgi:hypothetical protein